MKELSEAVGPLKKKLDKLKGETATILNTVYEHLHAIDGILIDFENLWVGGWGRKDFNYYREYGNEGQVVQVVNEDYFYDIIESNFKLSLDKLAEQIKKELPFFKKFQTHLVTELALIRDAENFKNENDLLQSLENFKWGYEADDFVKLKIPANIPIYDYKALSRGLDIPPHIVAIGYILALTTKSYSSKTFIEQAERLLRQIEIKVRHKPGFNDTDYSNRILTDLFDNFHSFYNQLRNRHNNRPSIEINDEYDVQDFLHALLRLHFKDVREEEHTPSYAGSSTRMDFLLKNEGIVIEVKKTRERLTDKELGQQLILDIAHYKNHPNCQVLKCFVYDPENKVKNPRGVESDIARASDESLTVELFVRP
ncbi:MAG: hypothetical protein ABI675_25695 [Chitinophagaceae bacterium]